MSSPWSTRCTSSARGEEVGVMEYWSNGVLARAMIHKSPIPVLQHSNTPSLRHSALVPWLSPYDAILLIAFGGPTAPEEIRPFLARVTRGIPIPPERLDEVAHHYEAVGGKSPLNEITFRQAKALQKLLERQGTPLPVYVGMRNAAPFFVETLEQMSKCRRQKRVGFYSFVAPHRSELGALSEKSRRRARRDRRRRAGDRLLRRLA